LKGFFNVKFKNTGVIMKNKKIIGNQVQNLIEYIFHSDISEGIMLDMEIEQNELEDIHYYLSKAH
jgi:hypothetical protein